MKTMKMEQQNPIQISKKRLIQHLVLQIFSFGVKPEVSFAFKLSNIIVVAGATELICFLHYR